jgi:cellulose synthase/poly-beta-1,6-N-acetylglucosamine synthase-like glycosyltransferase
VTILALALLAIPVLSLLYAYLLYPAALWCMARFVTRSAARTEIGELPQITITLPVHNEARILRQTLDHILSLDYPADRRHVLVISDGSTDATDAIVAEYADRGVALIALAKRSGKTAAENEAAAGLEGEIVVNVDATARPAHGALRQLVAAFADPTVGVASGRDLSVGSTAAAVGTTGESKYVGYEMWVRALETRVGSIVGASGCFYAIRRSLYVDDFPEALSRDFASALIAHENGYRAVSVDEAICLVPRASSLDAEFRRKARTMQRGLATLWYKRALLNPRKHGRFALMLASHKLFRWLVPLTLPLGVLGVALLATVWTTVAWSLGAGLLVMAVSALARRGESTSALGRRLALPSYVVMANAAGIVAWWDALRRQQQPVWEPTRRPV